MRHFKWMWFLLLTLAGCFGQGNYLPEPVKPTDRGATRIVASGEYSSTMDWLNSPWGQPGDVFPLPVFVVIDQNHRACVVDEKAWVFARTREWHVCKTGWRFAR